MNMLKTRLFALALAGLCSVAWPCRAAMVDDDFDDEAKPWQEIEVQLPAFPDEANLIPFTVSAATDNKFLIDANSLSVGADEVIRYTLVVVSSAGARNISYEGMRCSTVERRIYALGRPDQTWSKARTSKWSKIQGGANNPHVELYRNFFCTVGAKPIRNAGDAREVLRRGGSESAFRP